MSLLENTEVRESTIGGAGRGLFATKDLAPGDVVVAVDRPMIAELEEERMLDTCGWCYQRGATDPMERTHSASMGLPTGFIETDACTGCRSVSYCSKTCQRRAWKREHKFECKVLQSPAAQNLPFQVRAVVKLLGRMMAGQTDNIPETLKFRPFAGVGGIEEITRYSQDKNIVVELNHLAQRAWEYAGRPAKFGDVDGQVAAKALMFNVALNTFGLSCPLDDVSLGRGFDPVICSANHSCEPNVELAVNQPQVLLRAMKPIKKGQEIYMKYTDPSNPFSVRQAQLKRDYYFSCQCPKCKKGAVAIEDNFANPPDKLAPEYCELADKLAKRHEAVLGQFFIPMHDLKAQERLAAMQAEAFLVANNPEASVEQIKAALSMCIKSGMWSWTRQPVPELCRKLYAVHIETANIYRAFRIGCKMHFDIAPTLYPQKFHPSHLTNLWALSAITNVLCSPPFAEVYKELAEAGLEPRVLYFGFLLELHDNVPKIFGWESPFGRVVKSTYTQIMAGASINETEIRKRVGEALPHLSTLGRSVDVDSL